MRFAVIVLSTCLLAGCAVKVRVQESASGLAAGLGPDTGVAIAGVCASPAVGRLAPADAADAGETLYESLLAARPGGAWWPPAAVVDLTGEAALDSLLDEYARLGGLPADLVREVAGRLPGARYLAIARLESDAISTDTVEQTRADPEARAEGQPEHGSPWAMTMATARRLSVSLELVDLASGVTAWRGSAEARDRIRYAYDDRGVDPVGALQKKHEKTITRAGDRLQAPDLVKLLGKAFGELSARLAR